MAASSRSLPAARLDIQENRKWYNQQKVNLGEDFYLDVKARVAYIRENPLHYEKKHKSIRSARLTRFPYLVHYIFEKEINLVVILAVTHTSRNPEIWKSRIP